ncbi:MAG TPA: OmpH family outer membrane protein [Steroidobacteraceae bacterium]|nr:OmpH family outer membrane protein [Steroidobacteraceae bacterium]
MKRLNNSKLWGIAMAAAFFAVPAWAVDLKIAVVDYGRLVEESPQAKVALEAIRTEFTPRQREVENQGASLKAKEDKMEKDAATMSQEQRARAEKDLRDGARDLQRRRSEVQDDFNARRNEEMSRLQRALIEEVRTYAKAQNFDLVIADGVIYSVPTLDITPAILSSLQARAPKPAAGAAAPAAAPKPASPPK